MRLTLTPGAGCTSKRVTTGPGTTDVTWALTPKSARRSRKACAISSKDSSEKPPRAISKPGSSNSRSGSSPTASADAGGGVARRFGGLLTVGSMAFFAFGCAFAGVFGGVGAGSKRGAGAISTAGGGGAAAVATRAGLGVGLAARTPCATQAAPRCKPLPTASHMTSHDQPSAPGALTSNTATAINVSPGQCSAGKLNATIEAPRAPPGPAFAGSMRWGPLAMCMSAKMQAAMAMPIQPKARAPTNGQDHGGVRSRVLSAASANASGTR